MPAWLWRASHRSPSPRHALSRLSAAITERADCLARLHLRADALSKLFLSSTHEQSDQLSLGSHGLVALPRNAAREEVVRSQYAWVFASVFHAAGLFVLAAALQARMTAHKSLNARSNSLSSSTMGDRYGGGGGDGSYGGGGYGELPVPSCSQRIPSAARARRRARA